MLTVRPYHPESEADYEAIVAVHNAMWPDEKSRASDWRYYDHEDWPEERLFQRFIVEFDGKLIVEGAYMEPFWSHQPGKYNYGYSTIPTYEAAQHQGESLHDRIYAFVLDALTPRNVTKLCTSAREDKTMRIAYLEAKGFTQQMRYPESELKLDTFDATPFQGAEERISQHGIEIVTLPQLQERDSAWKEKLYELTWELEKDVPSPDPMTKQPIEEYEKVFSSPHLCPEGWFIAVDGEELVGISQLGIDTVYAHKMHTWLTGVVRSHRRKGVATALKLRAINFAQARGVKTIDTDNEENNPMYDLNVMLGFKPKPAWVDFHKEISPAALAQQAAKETA